ncbi:uncharacterized protein LOC107608250 isoform X4 [Arachis ipaensis]|uniref:uncharacterized protein LOC107608250 isoform X4 n=1 Tax=Arachis ipaensis TaxID=130454 RepID=UPI000A2B2C2B|nr:uncharacterized protein LOC107608250 isoform X4 [Arachis ipaensis]XP_029150483.1 uncharacterized protein LOC112765367 isoform X2 [Arachis hypogaea]
MANTISITQKVTCFGLGTLDKTQASKVGLPPTTHHHVRINSNIIKNNRCYVLEHNLGLFIFPSYTTTRKMNMSVFGSLQPGPVDPSSSPAHWKLWIIGTIFTILLSFSRGKWGPLLQLKETRMKEAEKIAEAVEEVAEGVEKVAEDVAKIVPEGKLHDAAQFVEKVAQDIDKHAQAAEDALEKAKDMEQDLESFFESTTHGQEKSVATTPEWKDQK